MAQKGRGRVHAFGVVGVVNITGDAVSVRPNIVIVELAVGPSKSPLGVPVEITKETILDLGTTPDRGLDL